jgi:hypothetical protein
MGCTEQIMFKEKVNRPYPYSRKHDFEHLQTKEEQMWDLNMRIEVTVEPLTIHLGESDDDSD